MSGPAARLLNIPDELCKGGVLQVPHAPAAPHKLPWHPELCGHPFLQGTAQKISQVCPWKLSRSNEYWGVSIASILRGISLCVFILEASFLYERERMFFQIYLSNFYSILMVFLQSIWSIHFLYICLTIYINDHSFHFIVQVEVLISSGQLNIEKEEIVFQVLTIFQQASPL